MHTYLQTERQTDGPYCIVILLLCSVTVDNKQVFICYLKFTL